MPRYAFTNKAGRRVAFRKYDGSPDFLQNLGVGTVIELTEDDAAEPLDRGELVHLGATEDEAELVCRP